MFHGLQTAMKKFANWFVYVYGYLFVYVVLFSQVVVRKCVYIPLSVGVCPGTCMTKHNCSGVFDVNVKVCTCVGSKCLINSPGEQNDKSDS